MSQQPEQSTVLQGDATHCCLMMDYALEQEYVHPTLTINRDTSSFKVHPPSIAGKRLTERGRTTKPNLLVNYCPWCGKKLAEDVQS